MADAPAQNKAPQIVEEEDDLQLVLKTAIDAVVVMRADGAVHMWNWAAENMFGWPAADIIGQTMGDLIVPPQHREAHAAGVARYLKTGEGPILGRLIELTALRRNGEEFPIELSIRPLKAEGEPLFLGFIRDISARKAEEERLETQAREARLLHRVASLAAESASTNEVIATCLDAVCELTGWPIGHAYVPDPHDPGQLVPTSIWSGPAEKFAAFRAATANAPLKLGEGLPGRVWKSGKPSWIDDLENSGNFPRLKESGRVKLRAGFAFPVRAESRIIAILEFFSEDHGKPDPRLLLTAQTIGEQAGRVLERQQAHDRQELLLGELNHRVKNMLAVVVAISSQTARNAANLDEFNDTFAARLRSLSATYGLLTQGNWESTLFADLIDAVVIPHDADASRISAEGTPIRLIPRSALALSMILHELSTNAVKYGALSTPEGRLAIEWSVEDGETGKRIVLTWRERGVTIDQPPTRRGFGVSLIETSVQHELGGQSTLDYDKDGLSVRLEFPQRHR